MTDHFPDAGKMVPNDRQVNILTDALHNANEDVKRFRAAASCERDVRVELEKQVGSLQAEVRRLHAENEALRAEAKLYQALVSEAQDMTAKVCAENEALKASQQECGFGAGCCYQAARSEADEALLWLCREMIQELPMVHPQQGPRRDELIQALNERLK